jgi:cell division protein ZapA (FtsZ GTPase activity inhibitor)
MADDDRHIQFEVLNERFTIRASVPSDYYLRLVSYLNGKLKKIREKIPNLSNTKALTFAALDIADELMKARNSSLDDNEVQLLSELSDSLASVIDNND